MRILITAPVRNREWILEDYLKALQELDFDKESLAFHFILNDSVDNSKDILTKFKYIERTKYRYIRLSEVNFEAPKDLGEEGQGRESGVDRDKFTHPMLAILRNLTLDLARMDNADYLFSVDSDIIVEPDILNKLIEANKDIVAGLISNGGSQAYNFLPFSGNRNEVKKEIFEVKVTGACCLISKNVFNNRSIRYSEQFGTGEDLGFCESARHFCFKSYVLPYMQRHILDRRKI